LNILVLFSAVLHAKVTSAALDEEPPAKKPRQTDGSPQGTWPGELFGQLDPVSSLGASWTKFPPSKAAQSLGLFGWLGCVHVDVDAQMCSRSLMFWRRVRRVRQCVNYSDS
jgi:hypothetical protein